MANFCMQCGQALPVAAKFCPNCGFPSAEASVDAPPVGNVAGNGSSLAASRDSQEHSGRSGSPGEQGVDERLSNLDIFFYVPMVVCALMALLNLMFIGALMRFGKGGTALFYILLNVAIAAALWKWPYEQYKRGDFTESRKWVMVFGGVSLVFVLLAIGSGQMITALLDIASLASLAYLYYKLGSDSWQL